MNSTNFNYCLLDSATVTFERGLYCRFVCQNDFSSLFSQTNILLSFVQSGLQPPSKVGPYRQIPLKNFHIFKKVKHHSNRFGFKKEYKNIEWILLVILFLRLFFNKYSYNLIYVPVCVFPVSCLIGNEECGHLFILLPHIPLMKHRICRS